LFKIIAREKRFHMRVQHDKFNDNEPTKKLQTGTIGSSENRKNLKPPSVSCLLSSIMLPHQQGCQEATYTREKRFHMRMQLRAMSHVQRNEPIKKLRTDALLKYARRKLEETHTHHHLGMIVD